MIVNCYHRKIQLDFKKGGKKNNLISCFQVNIYSCRFDPGECCFGFTWWDNLLHRVNCLRVSSRGSTSFQTRTGLTSQRQPKTLFPSCWFEMQHCASALHKSSSTRGCRGWESSHLCTENWEAVRTQPSTFSGCKILVSVVWGGELLICLFFFLECSRERSSNSSRPTKVQHSFQISNLIIRKWLRSSKDTGSKRGSKTFPTSPLECRNSSTKDLTQFAAEAIAFNRQLSQHDEQQEDAGAVVCTMRLSPPSNSRLARRRAQSSAQRMQEFAPSPDDLRA